MASIFEIAYNKIYSASKARVSTVLWPLFWKEWQWCHMFLKLRNWPFERKVVFGQYIRMGYSMVKYEMGQIRILGKKFKIEAVHSYKLRVEGDIET